MDATKGEVPMRLRGSIVVFALSVWAGGSMAASPAEVPIKKSKKPSLTVRALPRIAFSPATVLVSAELHGGDDAEEFHCLEVKWDWDDGGQSVHEPGCDPWQPGMTIERQFSSEHLFRRAGTYRVAVTLRRAGKVAFSGEVDVMVRSGAGDQSE
jgi:hypothetical protein